MSKISKVKEDIEAYEFDLTQTLHPSVRKNTEELLKKARIRLADLELHDQIISDPDNELGYMHNVGYTEH